MNSLKEYALIILIKNLKSVPNLKNLDICKYTYLY